MKLHGLNLLFLLFSCLSYGQNDSGWTRMPVVFFSGFVDVFYAFDFNKPNTDFRQDFFYNHNRHNEFNLNLGLLKATIHHAKFRGNFALQAGTYASDNYIHEPSTLRHIHEANGGISLCKKNTLWLDAGILASHIGFESPVSKDNWTLTRSLAAENSPYYLAGAKLSYLPNSNWEFAVMICNGWQRIKKISGNSLSSLSTQIKYSKDSRLILNWSSFIGTDDPDTLRRMRYFNHFFGLYQATNQIGLIAGFDIGAQQKSKGSSEYDIWYTPQLIVRYTINDFWTTAFRAEYYYDPENTIISTANENSFRTKGTSLNLDYNPNRNILCRIEGRWLNSTEKVLQARDALTDNNIFIVGSLAVSF